MPPGWVGLLGLIRPEVLQTYAPYYKDAILYISGPIQMVDAVKSMLHRMGVPDSQMKTDFFAGL